MLPDLGKYAVPVLSAYAATLVVLALLVVVSVIQARRMRHRLEQFEAQQRSPDRMSRTES